MSDNVNSKVQSGVWLKSNQVNALQTAVYRCRPDSLQERDDTIFTLTCDTGVRVGELVATDTTRIATSSPSRRRKDTTAPLSLSLPPTRPQLCAFSHVDSDNLSTTVGHAAFTRGSSPSKDVGEARLTSLVNESCQHSRVQLLVS